MRVYIIKNDDSFQLQTSINQTLNDLERDNKPIVDIKYSIDSAMIVYLEEMPSQSRIATPQSNIVI